MKRFYTLSILLHGAVILFIFTWEIPRAERLFAWSKIDVVLIEDAREKKLPSENDRKMKPAPSAAPAPVKRQTQLPAPKPEGQPKMEEKRTETKEEPAPNEMRAAAEHPQPAPLKLEPKPKGGIPDTGLNGFSETENKGAKAGGFAVVSLPSPKGLIEGDKVVSAPVRGGGEGSETASLSGGSSKEGDSILLQIIRRIEAAKRYPRAARKMGLEGVARVRFKIKPGGEVETVEIEESSGSDILDKASLETVRAAAPLPYKEGWLKVGIVFKIL